MRVLMNFHKLNPSGHQHSDQESKHDFHSRRPPKGAFLGQKRKARELTGWIGTFICVMEEPKFLKEMCMCVSHLFWNLPFVTQIWDFDGKRRVDISKPSWALWRSLTDFLFSSFLPTRPQCGLWHPCAPSHHDRNRVGVAEYRQRFWLFLLPGHTVQVWLYQDKQFSQSAHSQGLGSRDLI